MASTSFGILLLLAIAAIFVFAANKQADEVTSLPGLSFQPTFKHYSGYLDASLGNHLHYWFLEAQTDPTRAPLLLWLNGGPGCSSLGGLFTEHGPFRPAPDGKTLIENVFSWNKLGNILYLESPHDIGFSYRDNGTYGYDTNYNDDKTAADTLLALKDFFRAYPEYNFRDFYITGESYAGVYIPTLTDLILQQIETMPFLKFRGIVIGNGEMSEIDQINSAISMLYYRGMIGTDDYTSLWSCCANMTKNGPFEKCPFTNLVTLDDHGTGVPNTYNDPAMQACSNKVAELYYSVWKSKNDVYNTYQDCYETTKNNYGSPSHNSVPSSPFPNYEETFVDQGARINIDSTDSLNGFPCYMDAATAAYLNQPPVRASLHIPDRVPAWKDCDYNINSNYYHQQHHDTSDVFNDIIKAAPAPFRILFYNGDADMACEFLGDQWFVERLVQKNAKKFPITSERAKWTYSRSADFVERRAGYAKSFTNNGGSLRIDLLTVKGAGHYVPLDRPGPALQMLANFLAQTNNYSALTTVDITPKPLLAEFQPAPPAPVSRKEADGIYDLPGVTFSINFKQYSGYLEAAKGNNIFYWLFESQTTPSVDPLVLFLAGGPGCSGAGSSLTEIGPFRPNRDGRTLYENIYSWNKGANLLVIDSPRGVGFSWQNTTINPDNIWNDDRAASDVYLALKDFLTAYPEYINRPFYITGVSYGGVFAPTATSLIVDKITSGELTGLKLEGIAIGNGLLSNPLRVNSAIQMQYYHAFYGKEEYDSLQKCCPGNKSEPGWFEFCDFASLVTFDKHGGAVPKDPNDKCAKLVASMGDDRIMNAQGWINMNMYQDCYQLPDGNGEGEKQGSRSADYGFVDQVALKSLESTDNQDGFPCWNEGAATSYLNLPEVQAALHVYENITNWEGCSYDVGMKYEFQYTEMDQFFDNIIQKKYPIRMLLYNGDVDALCNFLLAQWFTERLATRHNMETSGKRQKWSYMSKVGGYQKQYKFGSGTIDLLTIKGGGHVATRDRPGPVGQVFNAFIHRADYSTPNPYAANLSPLKAEFKYDEMASAGGALPAVSPANTAASGKTRKRRSIDARTEKNAKNADRAAPPPPPPGSKALDEVTSLPGLTYTLPFKHYSGYLNPSEGNYLHYWLMEAQTNPATSPLILWLNGGPGCSSLNGLNQELGPFLYNRDGKTVHENIFGWNKVANVLFLESPRDVGFSYRANNAAPDNEYGDTKTAVDNVKAYVKFLERYPEYANRDLYLAGESYGGVYEPMFADGLIKKILNKEINATLKGVAIGNGYMSEVQQLNSAVSLTYFRGLTGKEDYDLLKKCIPDTWKQPMGYFDWSSYVWMDEFDNVFPKNPDPNSLEHQCALEIIRQGNEILNDSGNSITNTYKDCYVNGIPNSPQNSAGRKYEKQYGKSHRSKRSVDGNRPLDPVPFADEAKRMTYFSTMSNGGYDCVDGMTPWLNRDDVRKAIHIPEGVQAWQDCNDLPKYKQEYNDTTPVFQSIINSGYPLRFLFYNGDVDMNCEFLGDQWFTENLASKNQMKVGDRRPWMYRQKSGFKPLIAGYVQRFNSKEDGGVSIDLLTVKGAGHLVPVDRPGPALQMIFNFVYSKPYGNPLTLSIDRQPLLPQYQPQYDSIGRADADLIQALPGLTFQYRSRQHSGYLQALPGNKLFYWYLEAQSSPDLKPLVLWLTGGPGCSSSSGVLMESGPFRPNPDGRTLYENVHAWNKVANVLYIDSPRMVGFSYQNKSENPDTTWNDDKTIADLAAALTDFFVAYPNLAGRDFYITGESYGGVYVPALADLLVQQIQNGTRKLNLKGFAVGNGDFSGIHSVRSTPALLYYHGAFDKGDHDWLGLCCPEDATTSIGFTFCSYEKYVDFHPDGSITAKDSNNSFYADCGKRVAQMANPFTFALNDSDVYNLYQDCYTQTDLVFGSRRFKGAQSSSSAATNFQSILQSSMDPLSTDASGGFQCYMTLAGRQFLSLPSVRRALHVPDVVRQWEVCNDEVNAQYQQQHLTMAPIFQSLLKSNYSMRVLIYNGDVDTACSGLEAEWFIEDLAKDNKLAKSARTAWMHRGQIAGYVGQFKSDQITFDLLTVKGAGHLVPTDRPGPALQMMSNFLGQTGSYDKPVSVSIDRKPLLPQYQP